GKDELSTWYFSGEEGDPVASLHMKAVTAQSQWDRAEAKRVLQDRKAGNVRYVHGKFGQAGHQHPYLVKKGVQAARGVHIDDKQRLLIPLQNVDGVIRSMQTIDPEGNKRLTKDAEKSGNFFVVGGTLKNGRPIVCAEGYATAASGAMALRMPVVMAIDSGNLVKVAERLHQKYPDSPMLFLGDDDPPKPHRPGNPGKEAAEKAARLTGGIAVLPALTPEEKAQGLTDFNDLHQSRGLAALAEELAPLRQRLQPTTAPAADVPPELQPTETVIMNEPDNVNSEPAGLAEEESQMAAYEDWMASGQEAIPETVQPEPVPASPVAPEAAEPEIVASENTVPETAAPKTQSPDNADAAGAAPAVRKARRTKKTTPVDAKEKGSAKPAAATKKPRQKKATAEDKQDKPQQTAPAATESQSATRADPTPSLSSLLKQESPPISPNPVPEDEEVQPVIPPVNEAAPPLRKADTSGTDENGTPDNDTPVSDATPEPDGIRFERSRQARERIDLVALEGALLHKPGNERGTQQYLLDGERAFTRYLQQGRIIMATPQASQNDRMILGALLVAKQDMVLQGNIELTGSPAFKQRAINLIAEYDLQLKLTNPEQIKMLEDAREKLRSEPGLPDEPTPLGSEASEILVHPSATNASPQPGEVPASAAPASAATARNTATAPLPPDILPQKAPAPVPMNASHDEASAGLTGTLLEHGAAPYNFRKDESHSYYARLRTAEGERVVWGITLRAAIADAGLKNNDLVTLQMTGKETVTVDVKQKGEDGKPLLDGKGQPIYRKEERERNKWTARQAIDPGVVNADTRTMTPPGELLAYSLKDWNTLQAGVEELAKKAGVSLPDWPDLPDALWMEPAGKGVPSPDRRPDNPTLP
ncbi:hypothetical protein WDQ52_005259, partial [Salmonella enterica]